MHKYLGAWNFHEIVEQHCELGRILDHGTTDLDNGSAPPSLWAVSGRSLSYLIVISFHLLLGYMPRPPL